MFGVVGTILLNRYQEAGPRNLGEALEVVAVDFSRGVVVIRRAVNLFEVRRFDPRMLPLPRAPRSNPWTGAGPFASRPP